MFANARTVAGCASCHPTRRTSDSMFSAETVISVTSVANVNCMLILGCLAKKISGVARLTGGHRQLSMSMLRKTESLAAQHVRSQFRRHPGAII